ncbi:MAG: hypothetical protein ACK47B_28425 [Armatimonadota bacterium]
MRITGVTCDACGGEFEAVESVPRLTCPLCSVPLRMQWRDGTLTTRRADIPELEETPSEPERIRLELEQLELDWELRRAELRAGEAGRPRIHSLLMALGGTIFVCSLVAALSGGAGRTGVLPYAVAGLFVGGVIAGSAALVSAARPVRSRLFEQEQEEYLTRRLLLTVRLRQAEGQPLAGLLTASEAPPDRLS